MASEATPAPLGIYSSPAARVVLAPGSELAAAPSRDEAFERAKQHAGLGFASPRAGALILANTLLGGSGLLGIPFALSEAGYLLGLLLLVTFGCASAFGCHLLQCSARRIGAVPCSFYTVSNAVAPRWTWLIDGAVMVKCFGVGTSYLIIVGDLVPDGLVSFGVTLDRKLAVVMGFTAAGTLACLKNLSALRYTATGSMLVVAWTLVLIFLFFARPSEGLDPCSHQELPCSGAVTRLADFTSPAELGRVLPLFIFGFTCQQNIFTICNEVRGATQKRVDLITLSAYLAAGLSFATASVLVYATYGDQVQKDVLEAYPELPVVGVTRMLYSLLAVFSYPLQVHPARNSALALWRLVAGETPKSQGPGSCEPASPLEQPEEEPNMPLTGCVTDASVPRRADPPSQPPQGSLRLTLPSRFTMVTVVLLGASFTVALVVADLGKVLGVVGATGSTMVSYILPGIVYVQAHPYPHVKRTLAFCQLGLGCIIMPTCLVLLFI